MCAPPACFKPAALPLTSEFAKDVYKESFAFVALVAEVIGEIGEAVPCADLHIISQVPIDRDERTEPVVARKIIGQIAPFGHHIPCLCDAQIGTDNAKLRVTRNKCVAGAAERDLTLTIGIFRANGQ